MKRRFAVGSALLVAAVVAYSLGLGAGPEDRSAVQAAAAGKYSVNGYLTAAPPPTGVVPIAQNPIYVPGVSVTLTNLLTATDVARVRTDLSGRFTFPPQSPARYRACWTGAGFISGCTGTFTISNKHLHLGPRSIAVALTPGAKTFYGKVRLADGSVPRTHEPMANVNAFANVRVIGAGSPRPLRSAYVNNYGDYIAPAVPVSGVFTVQAHIESVSKTVTLNTASIPGIFRKTDFVLGNHAPEMRGLIGNSPAGLHWTAATGDFVNVTAQAVDADGDPLEYRWILPDGSSALHATAGQTVGYQLPDKPGKYEFTAVVYDKKGGYAKETIVFSTNGVRFAGTVHATDAPVVAGAEIDINGTVTATAGNGTFHLNVPESSRYVVNIRKAGYGLVSRIYDQGLTGGHWTLTRASVDVVDPRFDIDVRNRRIPSDCPGSPSDRRRRKTLRDCGPGIRVTIPANSLVDSSGNLPTGLVDVHLTTTDVDAPDGMPGDWGADDTTGARRTMESYGAGTVEFTSGGQELNLKPGAVAQVFIPITPQQLAAAGPIPAQVPFLDYDEKTGFWRQEGVATRVGNEYVATATHFSAKNMDQLKQGQSCVRLETTLMPPSFDVEVTIPSSGGGAPVVKTETVTNEAQRFHALYNLYGFQNIELRVFETGTSNPIELLQPAPAPPTEVLTVSTGGAQNPTDPNEPEFPYEACQTSVELTPVRLPPNTADSFLHGLFSFEAANLTELDLLNPGDSGPFLAASEAYYDTIDPKGLRGDLDAFKAKNGFPSVDEITAKYANSGDLGFGRDMHCLKDGLDVACYVTNYGDRFSDDFDDWAQAIANETPIATVGMEYSRIEDPAGDGSTFVTGPGGADLRVVKFYVFKEALASAVTPGGFNGRAASANLDGVGERPIPQLCMVCHGGQLPAETLQNGGTGGTPAWNLADPKTANLSSAFIPFDITSFTTGKGAAQQARFKNLNLDIVLATDPPSTTAEVIAAMYDLGLGVPENQKEGFFVSGWAGSAKEQEVYAQVVAPSCRACHISQGPTDISWNAAADFKNFGGSIDFRVCNTHEMPHAIVTHNRFWLSTGPHQPLLLHDFLNDSDPIGEGLGAKCVELGQ